MLKGQNQTDARDFNMKAIISYLCQAPLSCSELAVKTGLSKPALTKITVKMQEIGLLTVTECDKKDKENVLGRRPVYLTINPRCGAVIAVDFSTVRITIRLCDMQGNTIAQHNLEDKEFITYEILNEVISEVQLMCKQYLSSDFPLRCVCLAASGMINRDGVIVQSPKFSECRGLNLREYFQRSIGAPILVKNDIKVLLHGEEVYRNADFPSTVLLYIDSGIGGAISFNRSILEGDDGFAGEFGLMRFYVGKSSVTFDELSSINAMKKAVRARMSKGEACCLPQKFRFADLVKAFEQGDPLVKDVVHNACGYISDFINNICYGLNCRRVMIAGRVRRLGEEYLGIIRKNIPIGCNIEIEYNYFAEEAILKGAITLAIQASINNIIESR